MNGSTALRLGYTARLEGGPGDGIAIAVRELPSGDPPDFMYSPADDKGVYALAGAADNDGTLPYWWMPWARAAALRHVGPMPSPSRTTVDR